MNFGVDVSNNPKILILMGWLFASVSLIWLIIGGLFTVENIMFLPGSLSANGTIISCQFDKSVCSPTISFVTQYGQKVTFMPSSSSSSYREGDTLSVRYHPHSPQDAHIDDWLTNWMPPLLGSGGFLIFLFVGLFTLRRGRMLQAREEGQEVVIQG